MLFQVSVRIVAMCVGFVLLPEGFAADADAGGALYPVCAACHGPTGQGSQAMNGPKLAGQETWYLKRQMQLFQTRARGAAPGDASGMQMAAMAMGPQLQSEGALDNLVAYIATLPVAPSAQTVSGDVAAGQALYAVCAACHGDKGQGIEAMSGPRLVGQNDWYLVAQIKKYQQGQRGYDDSDHAGQQMRPMVGTLTGDEAVTNVVAYINSLQ